MVRAHKHTSGFIVVESRKERVMDSAEHSRISGSSSSTTSPFSPQALVLQVSLLGSFFHNFVWLTS